MLVPARWTATIDAMIAERFQYGLLGLLLTALCLPDVARADSHAEQTAAVVAEGWRHRVWAVYPPEKVLANEALPATNKMDAVRISAAQGEYEPLLIVLRAEVPLREVRAAFTNLTSRTGARFDATNFNARRVAYVYVDEPSGTRTKSPMPFETGTGLQPDPLPRGGGNAGPGRHLQFWITAHVPRRTPPGDYSGAVSLRFRREGWMPPDFANEIRVPLELRVRRFALPEISPLLNTAFFDSRALDRERRDPVWLHDFYRDFVAHRQAPQPLLPSPDVTVGRDGKVSVDSTEWERETAFCLDELKVSHLFVPVRSFTAEKKTMQGFDFLWHFPAVTKQWWFGAHIANEHRQLTPEFKERFGAYLRHMHGVLQKRGWLDRAFISTMDEPYTYHLHGADRALDTPANNYEVIRNLVKFVREVAPGLKTYSTVDPVPELNGFIDHWCLRNPQRAAAARERAGRHGELFTFCDNYRTFVDYPAVSARTLGWQAWKTGARGWLTYETMADFATAWEGPRFQYPLFSGPVVWGMGQMFYPEPAGAGVVPSLRWEMMRKGCEDYEYLWLLRERLRTLTPEQRASPVARTAQTLLDTAADSIVGSSEDPEVNSGPHKANTQSNMDAHRVRERVADLIEQLEPAPK